MTTYYPETTWAAHTPAKHVIVIRHVDKPCSAYVEALIFADLEVEKCIFLPDGSLLVTYRDGANVIADRQNIDVRKLKDGTQDSIIPHWNRDYVADDTTVAELASQARTPRLESLAFNVFPRPESIASINIEDEIEGLKRAFSKPPNSDTTERDEKP